MANSSFPFFSMATTLMFVLLIISISLHYTDAVVGVCYGQLGSNLPCPEDVVALYKQNNIKKMRLYGPDEATLEALRGSGIELMLGVPEADLAKLASQQCDADDWVADNVARYPDVNFRYIAVGNEVNVTSCYAPFVLPAMQHVHEALCGAGLGGRVAVSTSVRLDLLNVSYPPSAGEFKSGAETRFIKPIVEFLNDQNAPLLVNVYPYFAYIDNPKDISRSYALLEPDSGVCADGVYYDNLFYAMVDAVLAAMEKVLAPSRSSFAESKEEKKKNDPGVAVSETGHPSSSGNSEEAYVDGDGDVVREFSSVENARIYNNNLMRIVKSGTPMRPNSPIETYIFAMFDEDNKTGEEYERHFGIFSPDAKPKYPLRFY